MARMIASPPINQTLAAQLIASIRDAMIERGITQTDLAARLGVTPSTCSQMLSSKHSPRFENIERIAKAVGIRVTFQVEDDH